MKLKFSLFSSFLIIFTLHVLFSFCQTNLESKIKQNLLVGKWKFVKFDWPNFVPDTARIRRESEKQFKDVIYTFTNDKRLLISQSFKPKGISQNLAYSIKGNKIYVLPLVNKKQPPQIMEVDFLDEKLLIFYVEGSDPTGTFQRIK